MLERLAVFVPGRVKKEFRKELEYNNVKINERKFVGGLFTVAFILSLIAGGAAIFFSSLTPILVIPGVFVVIFALSYLQLRLASEGKGRYVETILPDALQLIASNMKSGLTTERSLFVAGRPEFGQLQFELKNASKKISSGTRIEVALAGISEKINSVVLEKTIWLISEGIKRGGQISDLLYQLADDLKNQQAIQEEIKANISIYVLLILFAGMVGAPMLFGVSSFIVQVISKQLSNTPKATIGSATATGGLSSFSGSADRAVPTTEFIMNFSIITLVITSAFAAITIGVINTGKELDGVKYVLPIIIIALILFFLARFLLTGFFGNVV